MSGWKVRLHGELLTNEKGILRNHLRRVWGIVWIVISVLLHTPRVQLRLQDRGMWVLLPLGSCYTHPALPGVQRALHTARPKPDWVPAHHAKISASLLLKSLPNFP